MRFSMTIIISKYTLFKGTFKIKNAYFCIPLIALFICVCSLGGFGHRDDCLTSNMMELNGTWHVVLKAAKEFVRLMHMTLRDVNIDSALPGLALTLAVLLTVS